MPSQHPHRQAEEQAPEQGVRAVVSEPIPPSAEPQAGPADAVRSPSWQRATALLGLGCLALGVALGCSLFAAAFFVTALLEPGDAFAAARAAVLGVLFLGAGLSAGLAWAVLAAVTSGAGARAGVEVRRAAGAPTPERAVEIVLG